MWCSFKKRDRNDIYVTRFVYNLGKRPLPFSHVTKMSPPWWGLPSSSQARLRASSEDDHWCWKSKHGLSCLLPASAVPTHELPPGFISKHSTDIHIPACQYIWSTSPFGEGDLGTCCYHTWSPLSLRNWVTGHLRQHWAVPTCLLWVVSHASGPELNALHGLFQLFFNTILIATDAYIFINGLLYFRHFSKHLPYINLLNLHNNSTDRYYYDPHFIDGKAEFQRVAQSHTDWLVTVKFN